MGEINEKLLKPYEPKETEDRIYKLWEKSGFFQPEADRPWADNPNKDKTFTIIIPPPNVTGSLHMGHALNATIQDILIRKKKMEGFKTLWLPGTDHAGIATQNVVEKQLKKEGLTRHDLGKEKFIEKIWEWKDEYGNIILGQLKKLGASCDWSRTKFTMDEDYAKAVETAFLHYYKKGWIYQGDRVVNWCKRCQTSLSDLELEYEDTQGKLYLIKYGPFTLATARPETKLGDTAVAVHPNDARYKDMVGKEYDIPGVLGNFKIKVVADKVVDPEFGSGAIKVTPAHSIIDSEIAERHNIPSKQIIDKYGKMMENCGKYAGLSTKDAREKIVGDMQKMGLIEKIEDYKHRVSKCYRCNSVIEPQISKQWFLKMSELAEKAKEAVKKGEVVFHPKRWEKVYFDWLDNIKDWCISRQIWWGHKIPLEGVDDVLDTWFSSALWPFATLGWPDKNAKDLKEFYPTQALSTARDIINLWVSRMIFSSYEFMDEKPFEDVIIHPTILTKEGKRMSKSLGTGIDPMVLIEKYSADATRFGLIYQMMGGQDIHWDETAVLAGKKFANKLWNIARFVLEQNSKTQIQTQNLSKEDEEILEKLNSIIKSTDKNIEEYKFGQALHTIYDFIWHDFADEYIEYAKKNPTNEIKKILNESLKKILILLHPFMPFITEEIWSMLPFEKKNLLIIEKWSTV